MSPSADKLCRFCLISRKDIMNLKTLDSLNIRDKLNYDEAVNLSAGIDSFRRRRETGVKRGCILNELAYFHIAENVTPDAMHDILEGLIPFTLKVVMNYWVLNPPLNKENNFSANLLNRRIKNFHYIYCDSKNKPSAKFEKSNLREIGNYNTKKGSTKLVPYQNVSFNVWGYN